MLGKSKKKAPGTSELVNYNKQVRKSNKYLKSLVLEWQKIQKMIVKLKEQIQKQKNLEQ